MLKRQKLWVTFVVSVCLSISQGMIAEIPEFSSGIESYSRAQDHSSEFHINREARNQARENAEKNEYLRLDTFKKSSFLDKIKSIRSGKVSLKEAWAGKPDSEKINQARSKAAFDATSFEIRNNIFANKSKESLDVLLQTEMSPDEKEKALQMRSEAIRQKIAHETKKDKQQKEMAEQKPKHLEELRAYIKAESVRLNNLVLNLHSSGRDLYNINKDQSDIWMYKNKKLITDMHEEFQSKMRILRAKFENEKYPNIEKYKKEVLDVAKSLQEKMIDPVQSKIQEQQEKIQRDKLEKIESSVYWEQHDSIYQALRNLNLASKFKQGSIPSKEELNNAYNNQLDYLKSKISGLGDEDKLNALKDKLNALKKIDEAKNYFDETLPKLITQKYKDTYQ